MHRQLPSAEQTLERGFTLLELVVDPDAGEVAGPGGREKLDPKVMDVLVMLAQHAGHVVLREDLLTRLWPGSIVTDDALTRCIYELRRQLSLAGGDERYKAMLETIPKRGYRLNGEVRPVVAAQPVLPTSRPKWPIAAVSAAVVVAAAAWFALGNRAEPAPEAYSVAVLPFADLSAEQDQEHFSDGISDEILNRLNQSPTLKVIARPSSFSFKGQETSIPEIAAKLHVTHVLEGSVRKSGNRVRLTARLAEASSNTQAWSETYDYELGDVFKIQEEIAEKVATALNATLAGRLAYVPKQAALEPFQRAEFFYNRRSEGDIVRAVKYYQQALSIDPEYARAWASLSGAYSLLAFSGEMKREEALAKQDEAARKAVALDPDLAVGYARLSQYYWDIGDRESAYRTLDRAIALDPNDLLVLTFLAGIAMRNGEVDGAIGRYDRIVALDPASATHHAIRGVFLQAAGRLDEAKAELETAKEFNPDLAPEIDLTIARILIVQKRFDAASSVIARLPDNNAGRDHGLALLYYAEGNQAEADAALERLVARSEQPVDIRLAEVYAFRGMNDQAFETLQGLQNAVDRNAPSEASQLWSWQVELRVSPFMVPLHDDSRWQALLVEPASVSS